MHSNHSYLYYVVKWFLDECTVTLNSRAVDCSILVLLEQYFSLPSMCSILRN